LDWRLLDTSEYKEIGDVGITRAVGGFATPDCVIDFPKLIAHLRRMAKDRGAHIIEGADVRKLKMDKGDKRIVGLEYDTNDGHRELDCKYCIVAMGAWSVKLLEVSGVTLPPIIRKKCIVLTYESELVPCITVCLDVQKESGAKSDVTLVPFKGKTLAAGTNWEAISDPSNHNIKDDDVQRLVDELIQCFPKLRGFLTTPHVCIKTERDTGVEIPDVDRKIYGKNELGVDGLLFVLPGKASFMFELASDIVKAFGSSGIK
jgi:glycine/D-amino acid oxidase-like deaminating enzyme